MTPICISLGRPKFPLGYEIADQAMVVCPRYDILKLPRSEYEPRYIQHLEKIGVESMKQVFKQLWKKNGEKELVLALAFNRSKFTDLQANSLYMMSDFAIRPSKYARLSKLVLVGALSIEAQEYLRQKLGVDVDAIYTTAFSTKPSMKYRGMFKETGKKDTFTNYAAKSGQFSLKEGLSWWIKEHSQAK